MSCDRPIKKNYEEMLNSLLMAQDSSNRLTMKLETLHKKQENLFNKISKYDLGEFTIDSTEDELLKLPIPPNLVEELLGLRFKEKTMITHVISIIEYEIKVINDLEKEGDEIRSELAERKIQLQLNLSVFNKYLKRIKNLDSRHNKEDLI